MSRGLAVPGLTARGADLLRGVVRAYLRDGEPVSSQVALREARVQVSPATVRVVLGELTHLGLLAQPHASAGRVPTAAGLRLYVDHFLRTRMPPADARGGLAAAMRDAGEEPEAWARAASRHLADTCTLTALVRRPRFDEAVVRRLDFLWLDRRRALAVLQLGDTVRHHLVAVPEGLDAEGLARAQNLFNTEWSGVPLGAVRGALRAAIEAAAADRSERTHLLTMAARAVDLSGSAEDELAVEGRTYLVRHAESPELASTVMHTLDDTRALLSLLDELAPDAGAQVVFGAQTGLPALSACTVVGAGFGEGVGRGAVAIIGPVRMDYARVVPWVVLTAEVLGERLRGAA